MARASGYGYIDLTSPGSSFKHTKFWRPKYDGGESGGSEGGGDSRYTITEKRTIPGVGTTRPVYRPMPSYKSPDVPDMPKFKAPKFEAPEFTGLGKYDVPDFNAPEYDEDEVSARTRKKSAPGLRNLRQQMNVAQTQQYENPNVKAMTMRDAMTGYGQGLESVMAGAEASARAEYGQEFQMEYETALTNYKTGVQQSRDEYDVLSRGLLASYQTDVMGARISYEGERDAGIMDYEGERDRRTMGYEAEREKRRLEYETEAQARQREYQDAWNDYLSTFTTEQTTRPMTEKEIRDAERNKGGLRY